MKGSYLAAAIMRGVSEEVIFDQGPKCNEGMNKVKTWGSSIPDQVSSITLGKIMRWKCM